MTIATLLDGLPDEWRELGREGLVIRFASDSAEWSRAAGGVFPDSDPEHWERLADVR
jgi:hypothetical protein